MTTEHPLTLQLAVAFGAYMLAAAISGFLRPRHWRGILDAIADNDALIYLSGVFAFTVGTALVLVHNHWGDPLAIVISVIGWAALIEGLVLVAVPGPLMSLATSLISSGNQRIFEVVVLALGLALLAAGLTGSIAAP